MPRTSNKPEEIMNFVNEFVQEHGYSPSVREIGEAVGLRSTASVSYHLQALQAKGILGSAGQKGRKRALAAGARPGQIPINYEKEKDKTEANAESLRVLLKYNIITPESAEKLVNNKKLTFTGASDIINDYRKETQND